ncbi:MAG: S-layer homology domain-containing protein [Candidatus Scatomorpha sp.]
MQTIDGVDYVRFTASELPGQAEAEGWESDNRVIFTGDSINSVSCAFDDSNTTYGTLWELTLVSQYFTLSYNSNGGTEYVDELYLEGTEVQLDKVPELDGHTFAGWFADEDLTQQIDTITMNDHSTVHAGWEKDEEPWTPPYIPPETPVTPSEPVYTPNWLNTTDHVSYIIGYSDGTVKPGAGITRAEVATIFFRLLTDGARERFWSETNAYTDVAAGSWYNIAVSTLSNMGILGGYEDGTFRPNASITRAEFAKIAVSFFDWADVYAVNSFVDVRDSAWYANYVAVAAELGLIEGYGGNVFRPDATITRAEACTIINRTLGRAPDADHLLPVSQMNTWPDNSDTGVWYYAQIQEATNSHDYRWLGDVEQWTAKLADPDWDKLQY